MKACKGGGLWSGVYGWGGGMGVMGCCDLSIVLLVMIVGGGCVNGGIKLWFMYCGISSRCGGKLPIICGIVANKE